MDDLTDHLPAVIVRLNNPVHAFHWYLTSTGITPNRNRAARKAMRQAQRDLRLLTRTPTLQPAESTPR